MRMFQWKDSEYLCNSYKPVIFTYTRGLNMFLNNGKLHIFDWDKRSLAILQTLQPATWFFWNRWVLKPKRQHYKKFCIRPSSLKLRQSGSLSSPIILLSLSLNVLSASFSRRASLISQLFLFFCKSDIVTADMYPLDPLCNHNLDSFLKYWLLRME